MVLSFERGRSGFFEGNGKGDNFFGGYDFGFLCCLSTEACKCLSFDVNLGVK
ncbi:hypothetical protein V6Z12_D07G032600 [Gossypium hirsutum]